MKVKPGGVNGSTARRDMCGQLSHNWVAAARCHRNGANGDGNYAQTWNATIGIDLKLLKLDETIFIRFHSSYSSCWKSTPWLAKFLEFPPKQSRALISPTSHPAAPTGWVAFVPAQVSQRSTLWSRWSPSRPRNDGVWWEAGFVRLSDFLA